MKVLVFLIALLCISGPAFAVEEDLPYPVEPTAAVEVPEDVRALIPEGYNPIMIESGDLNGDGREDYALVIEKISSQDMDPEQRPLLILTREENKSLKLAARSNRVVFCSTCGGIFGDPLAGIEADENKLTVHLYGGSAWRWGFDFEFSYEPAEKAWFFSRGFETSFHATEPENREDKVFTPKETGRINFTEFDPETYRKSVP